MTPERWRAMRAVVQAALERPPGERPAFVAEACGADAALQADVDALLAVPDTAPGTGGTGGTGGTPARRALVGALARVASATGRTDDAAVSDTDTAARLEAALAGRYAIEREIGRGGMATVYLARDLRHKRQVAVKVLHAELAAVL